MFIAARAGTYVRTLIVLLLVAAIRPHSSWGQTLTLDELLQEVRDRNPMLQASYLGVEALEQRGRDVSALPDPMVMLAYQPFSVLTARGAQRTQLRLEQTIPFPGKRSLRGKLATSTANVARHDARSLEQDLLLEMSKRFYVLYQVQEQLVLVDQFHDRLLSFEDVAATRYEVGAGGQQAILKAQIERNNLDRRRLSLLEMRRVASEVIARLVDRSLAADSVALVVEEIPPIPDEDDEELLEAAWQRRSERAALDAAKARADDARALAQRDYYPDFGVNLTYFDIAKSSIPPTATGRDALALGASVKVPLQRGRLAARLEEARLRQRQVQAHEEDLRALIRNELLSVKGQLEIQFEQWQLIDKVLIPQAEITLEATLSAYTTGKTSFLDLLDAERMLFSLESAKVDATAEYLKNLARFDRALGRDITTAVNAN